MVIIREGFCGFWEKLVNGISKNGNIPTGILGYPYNEFFIPILVLKRQLRIKKKLQAGRPRKGDTENSRMILTLSRSSTSIWTARVFLFATSCWNIRGHYVSGLAICYHTNIISTNRFKHTRFWFLGSWHGQLQTTTHRKAEKGKLGLMSWNFWGSLRGCSCTWHLHWCQRSSRGNPWPGLSEGIKCFRELKTVQMAGRSRERA